MTYKKFDELKRKHRMTDFNRTDLTAYIEALQVTVGNLLIASDGGKHSRNLEIAAEIIGENLYSACVAGDFETAMLCLDDAMQYLATVVGADDRIIDFRAMQVREELRGLMPVEKTVRAAALQRGDKIDIGGTLYIVKRVNADSEYAVIDFESGDMLMLANKTPVTVLTSR